VLVHAASASTVVTLAMALVRHRQLRSRLRRPVIDIPAGPGLRVLWRGGRVPAKEAHRGPLPITVVSCRVVGNVNAVRAVGPCPLTPESVRPLVGRHVIP